MTSKEYLKYIAEMFDPKTQTEEEKDYIKASITILENETAYIEKVDEIIDNCEYVSLDILIKSVQIAGILEANAKVRVTILEKEIEKREKQKALDEGRAEWIVNWMKAQTPDENGEIILDEDQVEHLLRTEAPEHLRIRPEEEDNNLN
jgi:hypothetical protein